MTPADGLPFPPGIDVRPLTRFDAYRLSGRTFVPRECLGFIASRDGADIAAAMAALGTKGEWWIAAWFSDGTTRRYTPSVYRIALMWLAGLKAAGLGPFLAVSDPGVPDSWFVHLGFVRNGEQLGGREVMEWRGRHSSAA